MLLYPLSKTVIIRKKKYFARLSKVKYNLLVKVSQIELFVFVSKVRILLKK